MEPCIVCGMEVKISEEAESIVWEEKKYYFCTTLCKIMFIQDPEKYIEANNQKKSEDEN